MIILVSCFVGLFSICWVFKKFFYQDVIYNVPSPKGYPYFGNIFQLDAQKPHLQLAKWAKQYGGMYKLNLAGQNVLVVNSYDLIHQVLVTNGHDFSGRPKTFRIGVLTGNYSVFGFENRTPKMKHMKKQFMSHVKTYGSAVERMESVIMKGVNDLLNHLHNSKSQPIHLKQPIMECLAGIICCMAIGRNPTSEEMHAILSFVSAQIRILAVGGSGELLDKFPWLRYIGNATWKEIQSVTDIQESEYSAWKQEVVENNVDSNISYLRRLLNCVDEDNDLHYTEENAKHSMWVMFAAGVGTTTGTMTSLINVLVYKKDIQAKLHKESISVLQEDIPSLNFKSSLPYHLAVIHEAVRYFSVVPLAAPHVSISDTELGGVSIPKGAMVWPNLWHLNHDEYIWGDPFVFRPERYLDDNGHLVAADHPARKHNLAFSAGPRVCAGELFAISRMLLMLAAIVQHFEIKPASTLSEQASCDCRDMIYGMTLAPPPIQVRFVPRQAKNEYRTCD